MGLNGMAGSLLVSGNPQHYNAIGEGGQPVYAVAFQLREAIRLKAGVTTANCLAVPQSNQYGSMVDWYAPVDGDVVPWSAATSGEREHALSKLDSAHRALQAAISKMTLTDARSSQAEREINTVLPLMSKVFHFPDTNFIYLVNGEPVIAFWGFHSQGGSLPSDPFISLRPSLAATIDPATVSASSSSGRHRWWWWLLLLLLLLLLFFFLRGCVPASWFGMTTLPGDRVTTPGTTGNTLNPQTPDGWIDRGVSSVQRWVSGGGQVTGVESAPPQGTTTEVNSPGQTTPDSTRPDPVAAAPNIPSAPESPAAPELPSAPGVTPPTLAPPESQSSVPPGVASPNPERPNPGAQTSGGNPMTIPQQALNSGNVGFLDGSWTAGTGIQDAKTGKPLRIEYDFSQGNGQGKVTIRRADGSQCIGAVGAQMQGKSLQINDKGVAKCSDGGTMALPKVVCLPQPDGRADCQGRYENGTTFPVSMRHAPK